MKHTIQHDLDTPTAKKVVERAFAEYSAKYAEYRPNLSWASDRKADVSFNAKGVKLNGAMEIEPGNIGLELDVPFLLRPFQKKAIEVIDREVRVWLAKAKAGEI